MFSSYNWDCVKHVWLPVQKGILRFTIFSSVKAALFTVSLTSGSGFDAELSHRHRVTRPVPVQPVFIDAGEERVNTIISAH